LPACSCRVGWGVARGVLSQGSPCWAGLLRAGVVTATPRERRVRGPWRHVWVCVCVCRRVPSVCVPPLFLCLVCVVPSHSSYTAEALG